jgi:sortase A
VISGHRTTYGAPFHELDTLVPGDLIEVETALGTHTYAVRETIIVRPTELWVTEPREGAWLTLTTCHPKFSSRQRLVVFAELVDGPNWEAIYA